MKAILKLTLTIYLFSSLLICQEEFYWGEAPTKGTKLYSIVFINSTDGFAKSKNGETFVTTNNGKNWTLNKNTPQLETQKQPLWSAEIYCSVMQTIDGGNTWSPYYLEEQEHFCKVYFKDNNTGWKVAEEFLNKVVFTINEYIGKDDTKLLVDHPHQCTEYYTNIDSGWALGWCVGNFENFQGISME